MTDKGYKQVEAELLGKLSDFQVETAKRLLRKLNKKGAVKEIGV